MLLLTATSAFGLEDAGVLLNSVIYAVSIPRIIIIIGIIIRMYSISSTMCQL